MNKFILIQIFFKILHCHYIEIKEGKKELLRDYTTSKLQLCFKKRYFYEGQKHPYLVSFDNSVSDNKIYVLVLSLPFLKDKLKNHETLDQQQVKTEIEQLFQSDYSSLLSHYFL